MHLNVSHCVSFLAQILAFAVSELAGYLPSLAALPIEGIDYVAATVPRTHWLMTASIFHRNYWNYPWIHDSGANAWPIQLPAIPPSWKQSAFCMDLSEAVSFGSPVVSRCYTVTQTGLATPNGHWKHRPSDLQEPRLQLLWSSIQNLNMDPAAGDKFRVHSCDCTIFAYFYRCFRCWDCTVIGLVLHRLFLLTQVCVLCGASRWEKNMKKHMQKCNC